MKRPISAAATTRLMLGCVFAANARYGALQGDL